MDKIIILPRDGLYIVNRSSNWGDDTQPCGEAIQVYIKNVDRRTVDNPNKVPAYRGKSTDWWYTYGSNHRVENGRICRDLAPKLVWIVELPTLSDLYKFIETYGECVINKENEGYWTLEIYDSYRE